MIVTVSSMVSISLMRWLETTIVRGCSAKSARSAS